MPKALALTAELRALIERASPGTDPTTVTAYEAIVLNTLPISKKGSIFNGAVMSQKYLQEMADYVEGGNFVPLHTLHDQANQLPFGRIVKAQLFFDAAGLPELRTIYYVDNQHNDLILGIESGSIEEHSIGAQPKHMLCSECGFDYLGESSTFMNIWDQTCDKEHEIGKEGVHLNVTGLDRWYELSLVSIGAAKGAKIVPNAKALMPKEDYNRLAASGHNPELTFLSASATKPTKPAPVAQPPKDTSMDLAAAVTQLVDSKTALGLKTAEALQLTGQVTDLTTKLSATTTELATAKTEADALKVKLTAAEASDGAKEKTRADAATKVLFDLATKQAVASGGTKPAEDATVADLQQSLADSQAKLSLLIPGARSQGMDLTGGNVANHAAASSFNTRR
ncbi:hypothetical protein Lumi_009 [Xylophilus phage Lumi]|nr:hypothetical protein Lumi_009 [Xylophilus phage Lumi]